MAHWIDDLARSVARSTMRGAFREAARGRGNRFALIQSPAALTLLNGPCGLHRTGDALTRTFATQSSTADGQLVSFTSRSTRDLAHDSVQLTTLIQRGATPLVEFQTTRGPDGPPALTLSLGTPIDGPREMRARIVAGRLEGADDDQRWPPLDLGAADLKASPLSAWLVSEETVEAEPTISPALREELRDVANKAQREQAACLSFPELLTPLAGSPFPGCDDCMDGCEEIELNCPQEALEKASDDDECPALWLFPVCLFYFGAACLDRAANCYKGCKEPPGKCCPKRCQRDGVATCCATAGLCCGGQCCPDGAVCADATHDLCCGPGAGPACGSHCCQPGFKCANLALEFCCAADAGDYCPTVFNEEQWTPNCCPPNEVCAELSTGLCCPLDHGPVCGNQCCQPGEVCRQGSCCRPHELCGEGDRAICCFGECRDGECCANGRYCGDVCCAGFGSSCCALNDEPVCCGYDEVCLADGCCLNAQKCGRKCCAVGERCDDPEAEVCVACPDRQVACVGRIDEAGRPRSICCPPNVNCCGDVCCSPGETCCGSPPGCQPSHYCIK